MKKEKNKDKLIAIVDVTPKWVDLYPLFCEWIDSGSKEQKEYLKGELLRLCKVADAVNASKGASA
ncbi:Uncharacterised protein [uncultured archaeon]|nr:Uncharacterised protein [uncultured archaeon]